MSLLVKNIKEEKMNRRTKDKIKEGGLIAIILIVLLVAFYGLSWIVTCGVIKLITMCFGWTFKWSIATGAWLIICIMQGIFKTTVNK